MSLFRFFTQVFILGLASPVFAWNEFGHMLIAEMALQKLEPKLQRQIEQQAFSLVRQEESDRRLYLMRTFSDTSAFAQLSVFADEHRDLTLHNLYQKYGLNMPAEFAGVAQQTTSNWHYKNQPYVSLGVQPPGQQQSAQCDLSEPTDVAWAIEGLQQVFNTAQTEQDRTLALALLIHFVGDAHQPLHTISRVDGDCESDRGGSAFCVVYRKNSYSCETNLHAFWDSALGFFESYETVAEAVDFVSRVKVDEVQANNLNALEWVEEGYRQARFVYSIKDGSGGDPYYIKDGQIIAYERMALAAERLARILDKLY